MAIDINNYVDITSGVGAGAVATTRSLVGRLFTGNLLVPPGTFLTFSTAAAVGSFFGTGSEEYARASFYFGWTSKNTTSPQSIQFARWTNVSVPPMIYSVDNDNPSLAAFQALSSGGLGLTIGGVSIALSSINYTSAGDFEDVADFTQMAIRGSKSVFETGTTALSVNITALSDTSLLTVGQNVIGVGIPSGTTVASIVSGTAITISNAATIANTDVELQFYNTADIQFALSTVTFNSLTNGFDFVGGDNTVNAIISVQPGLSPSTDVTVSGFLGWIPEAANDGNGNLNPTTGAIWANGKTAESITNTLTFSSTLSNNFGSFLFLTNLNITLDQAIEAATWNQTQNVLYMYTVPVTSANSATWSAQVGGLGSFGGVGLTISDVAGQYPEQMPMMIEAATDYTAVNSVQNYMFQIFPGITPSVTTDAQSASLDAASVNYYGSTQTAGQLISFYQRGLLLGASNPVNITDMNAYVNEIWFKDAMAVAILNLLLGLAQVSANAQGRSQILATIQSVISQALNNGTISVGKTLSAAQQAFITNETNDNKAWYQVQNSGYWVDCQIVPIPNVSPTQYEADYTLIYSKDDVIRKVVGTQTLI